MTKRLLKDFMRKYYTSYISQFLKESQKEPFTINMTLHLVHYVGEIEFVLNGYKKEEFDSFFRSVFKDKIKLIKCGV